MAAEIGIDELKTLGMRGMCSVLALVVHDLTGWPLVGVCEVTDRGATGVYHVACRAPDALLVDVAGRRDEKDVLADFAAEGRHLGLRDLNRDFVSASFRRDPVWYQRYSQALPDLLPEDALALPRPGL
ncbi:conserved hypothetical protein [Hyphomicrobiales bacterium]|jgi:hypothetical protein|nr:conserved hypothetical protein [Hyphomicrobiales bacterium]CAH1702455.1 hypothetical protein BOSEA1005_30327 [Hyphomicrobiales bacterium]CAI0346655.1 conserved hypothetical protein [Hyphomicrobiales bacterium]